MLPTKISIRTPYSGRQAFLKDPKANLYLSIGGKIFPLHRQRLEQCQYIKQEFKEKKIYLIQEPLDVNMVEKVLAYFYGHDIVMTKKQQLVGCLDVVDYFRAQPLRLQIEEHIGGKIMDYDVFFIMELAFQFSLPKIFKLTFQALEMEEFEQINYNKFDFIQCDFKLFQIVLRRHHSLKNSAKILGQSFQIIEEIISLYCQRYHFNCATEERLLQKYGRKSATKIKLSAKTDRSYVQPTQTANKTERLGGAESSRLEYYSKNTKVSLQKDFFSPRKNTQQKSTSPQSNLVSSARLKKNKILSKKSQQQNVKTTKMEPIFKFGGDSSKTKKQTVPTPIPQQPRTAELKKRAERQGKQQIAQFSPNIRVIETSSQSMKENDKKQQNEQVGKFDDDDPESMVGKISTLLDKYVVAYQEHEDKFEEMKKNAKSMIFKQNEDKGERERKQSIFDAGRITMSRGLDRNHLSSTLQIPQI